MPSFCSRTGARTETRSFIASLRIPAQSQKKFGLTVEILELPAAKELSQISMSRKLHTIHTKFPRLKNTGSAGPIVDLPRFSH